MAVGVVVRSKIKPGRTCADTGEVTRMTKTSLKNLEDFVYALSDTKWHALDWYWYAVLDTSITVARYDAQELNDD